MVTTTEIEELIKSGFYFPTEKILSNIWINNGACIPDESRGYPPFQQCFIHIRGQVPSDYTSELTNCIEILYSHMVFWSMVHIFENFMGMITEIRYLEKYKINVKKIDVLKGLLLGKEREHTEAESLGYIRRAIHDFLYFGLKSNHIGLEEEVSEQYLPGYIAGKYFSYFEKSMIGQTKKVLCNVTEENIKRFDDEFKGIWTELENRIEDLIKTTSDLERKFYQEYQLRLVEKTQELTLLSILIATATFLISKIPFDKIYNLLSILITMSIFLISSTSFYQIAQIFWYILKYIFTRS